MTTTLESRIQNLEATAASLESAGADAETIDPIYGMLAVYRALQDGQVG